MIPGLTIGKVFAHRWHVSLGLGVGISRFEQEVDNLPPGQEAITVKSSTTKVGFVPSLGLEYAWTKNISLALNAAYEFYPRTTKIFGPEVSRGLPNATYRTSVRPRFFTGRVGLIIRM